MMNKLKLSIMTVFFFRKRNLYVQNIGHLSLKKEVRSRKVLVVFLNIIYIKIFNILSLQNFVIFTILYKLVPS